MPTISEQLAKEQQDTAKKTAVIIFNFLKKQLNKVNLVEKFKEFLESPEKYISNNEVANEAIKTNDIEKMNAEDVEILSAEELKDFEDVFSKHNVAYDVYFVDEETQALAFEGKNLAQIEGAFAEYVEASRPSLDFRLEKAESMLPEMGNVEITKELER